jgi:hypothetical protein
MSIRVFPKMYASAQTTTGSDIVLFALPLPGGAVVNQAWMEVHCVGSPIGQSNIAVYGLHGYVLPVLDPDAGTTPDAMWDAQVPKDAAMAADVIDLDTVTAVSTPVLELGEPSIARIIGMTTSPVMTFAREKLVSAGLGAPGYDKASATFLPTDFFQARLKRRVEVDVPSYYLIGLSVPDTLATLSAFPVINTDGEWMQLKYMQYTLHQAFMRLAGLTEAGAESPYDEAMTVIANYLEVAYEQTAGVWSGITWNAMGKITFDITLPGNMDVNNMTAQPGGA